jgi:hypothetical protein
LLRREQFAAFSLAELTMQKILAVVASLALVACSGSAGSAGSQGATGATGAAGAPGSTGATGPQGDPGTKGATGATGAAGAFGLQGAPGSMGATGAQGLTWLGAWSATTNYTAGDGVSYAGSSYIATGTTITVAPPSAPWSLLAAEGATGATGVTGSTGTTGSNGATGVTGVVGATGVTGATGDTGSSGLAGVKGATGATGATGVSGLDGAKGVTGSTGLAGATGATGSTGATGATGATGLAGATGATGTTGVTGATGTFSGTFSGAASFTGSATFSGATALNGATTYTVGAVSGLDLFNASHVGTYPLVRALGNMSGYYCTAPNSFSVAPDTYGATFGNIVYTNGGAFFLDVTPPQTIATSNCGNTAILCAGPFTYFLNNAGSARTIPFASNLDNGPSYVYIDGNTGPNGSRVTAQGGSFASILIPAGKFALSVMACSNDGPSIGVNVSTTFISATNSNLTVD